MTHPDPLDLWARRARGTQTIRSRMRAISRLDSLASRCCNGRRHYCVTVRAWRAIDAHEDAIVRQLVRAARNCGTHRCSPLTRCVSWSASIGGVQLTERRGGLDALASDHGPVVRLVLERAIARVSRELRA